MHRLSTDTNPVSSSLSTRSLGFWNWESFFWAMEASSILSICAAACAWSLFCCCSVPSTDMIANCKVGGRSSVCRCSDLQCLFSVYVCRCILISGVKCKPNAFNHSEKSPSRGLMMQDCLVLSSHKLLPRVTLEKK